MGEIADYSAYKQAFGESPVMMATLRSIAVNSPSPLFAPLPLVVPTNSVGLSSADSPLLPAPEWPGSFSSQAWLAEAVVGGFGTNSGTAVRSVIWLADFLVQSGGMSGTVTTEQTTGLPTVALSRYTNGDGIMAALIVYTSLGSTATTATLNYTNQSGTAGRTSQPIVVPASAPARLILVFCLQDGDTGVRSVEGLTLAGSTGTAGNFGVLLFKPIAMLGGTNAEGVDRAPTREMLLSGGAIAEILQEACLAVLYTNIPNSGSPVITAQLRVIRA